MHIKTIIVDGFKSYATRTEIAGFDPEFNAITGLNGSGKSNILDAICFVLGISNLTQVRGTLLSPRGWGEGPGAWYQRDPKEAKGTGAWLRSPTSFFPQDFLRSHNVRTQNTTSKYELLL